MDRQVATRALRNAPALASVVLRHLGRSPAQAAFGALRAVPPARRAVTGPLAGRLAVQRPALLALAQAASGRREESVATLRAGLETGAAPVPLALAAVAVHRTDVAEEALAAIPEDHPQRARAVAVVRAEQGHLSEALEAARSALAGAGPLRRPAARALVSRLQGEVEILRAEALLERLPEPVPPPRGASVTPRVGPRRTDGGAAPTPAWVKPGARPVVLHVVTNALPEIQAGYTIRTHGIATAQVAAGWEPHVVTRLGFPVDVGRVDAGPVAVVDGVAYHHLLPSGPVPAPGRRAQEQAVREVVALARRIGAQVLHAHSRHENAQVALLAGHELGLPVVYEVRGLIEETWRSRGGDPTSDHYRWSREAETVCLQRAQAVVTLAGTMRDDMLDRGIPAERVVVVGNAVPDSFLEPLPARDQARDALGLPKEAFVVGTVTTINDYEGLDTLVEALAGLPEDPRRPVHLFLVGDGPARAALAERAAQLGLSDRIHLPGRVPHGEVRHHLAALDLFAVPRRRTPVTELVPPIKPVEAMASGLAVLASDLPPLVEIVVPGVGGLVVEPEDPARWQGAVELLRYDQGHVDSLGAAARELVRDGRTWTAAVARYDEVYTSAASVGAS